MSVHNIQVIIDDTDVSARIWDGYSTPITWSLILRNRGTASVYLICSPFDAYTPAIGQPIYIYCSGVCRFCGTIDTITNTWLEDTGWHYWALTCVSFEQCFDTIQVFPPRSYFGVTAGSIVRDLLVSLCAGVPVISGAISEGPVIASLILLSDTVSDVFNSLATQAGFIWGVDCSDQSLYFCAQSTKPAPFTLETTDIQFADQSGTALSWQQTRQNFRDRQTQVMATDATPITPSTIYVPLAYANPAVVVNVPNLIDSVVSAQMTTSTLASATGAFSGIPSPGDTLTIGLGVPYTFVVAIDNTQPRQVIIGSSIAQCTANLVDAINANFATIGTAFSFPTMENEYMAAMDTTSGSPAVYGLSLMAKALGTAGNGIAVISGCSVLSIGAGAAPIGGITFDLSSDNAHATVPASVTVTSGNSDVAFAVTTTTPGSVAVQVNITATDPNGATLIVPLVVNPSGYSTAAIATFDISPGELVGGASNATGTVTLSAPALSNVLVNLYSNAQGFVLPPLSVVILATHTSVSFTIPTQVIPPNVGQLTAIITAVSANSVQQTLLVDVASYSAYLILSVPVNSIPGGQSLTIGVTVVGGHAGITFPATVALTSSDPHVVVPASLTFLSSSTQIVPITTTSPPATITALLSASCQGRLTANSLTVTSVFSGNCLASELTLTPNPVPGGTSVAAVLILAPSGEGADGAIVALTAGTGEPGTSNVTYVRGQTALTLFMATPISAYLYVVYNRLGGDRIVCENTGIVAARAAVEAGTGKYQVTASASTLTQVAAALLVAQQALEVSGGLPATIQFCTYRSGLAPGQYINIAVEYPVGAPALLNGPWLVQQVNASYVPGMQWPSVGPLTWDAATMSWISADGLTWDDSASSWLPPTQQYPYDPVLYTVTLVNVPQIPTWIELFENLTKKGTQ